jgi:putative ABC transport system permease protein
MGDTELASAFDMRGAFNDVALTLEPGASEPEILRRLDRLTEPYGGLGAFGRADQPSHKFVSNEINELRGMALVVPTIFLSVAAFLLNVVLSRLIGTQREQIAALKAFGYTRWEVALHYLKLVLLIVSAGVILGVAVGARLGLGLAELYTRFFRFPVFAFHLDAGVVLLAFLVSTAAAVAGTLGALGRAARLPPAEAMRPEPPAAYRPTLLERIGLQRLVPPVARMILRQLERRPLRSLLSCLGIALAVAVLVLGYFSLDALDYVMGSQFELAEREDLTVSLVEPRSSRALSDLEALPGVRRCEPFRAVPARLRFGHRSRRLGLMGVQADGELYRLLDMHRRPVALPADGVVLSEKLADLLGVRPGESLTVEVLEGSRPVRAVVVAALVEDFAGLAAYMDIRAVNRLMREGRVVSGAFLAVEPGQEGRLYSTLKATPEVAGVTVKRAALSSFRQTVAENLLRMRLFNIIFAGIIAFGVVYNSARIAAAERGRELATLRVIGFTRAEISLILLGELALLTLAAIPAGMALGYGLAAAVIRLAYDTELFRIPLIVSRSTYGFAAAVTLAAALVSGLVVRRMLDRLDLVAVLKSKE